MFMSVIVYQKQFTLENDICRRLVSQASLLAPYCILAASLTEQHRLSYCQQHLCEKQEMTTA